MCFCPLDYRSFLKREVPMEQLPGRGHFLDEKGNVLGWHEGYPFYTIGQRRGLGIHLNRAVFVKEVRMETNEVVLAPLASLYRNECILKIGTLSVHIGIGSGNGYRKDTLSQAGKPLYGCSGGERISAGFAVGTVGVYRPGASRRLL